MMAVLTALLCIAISLCLGVDRISLPVACSSRDKRLAALASAMVNLQTLVVRHFQPAHGGRERTPEEREALAVPAAISPRLLKAGPSMPRKRHNSCPLIDMATSFRRDSSPLMPKLSGATFSSQPTSGLSDCSFSPSSTEHSSGDSIMGAVGIADAPQVEAADRGEAYAVLLKLVENIKFKVSKETLWSRDLHEVTSDYVLPARQFVEIGRRLEQASQKISSMGIRRVSNSPARPCWAIVPVLSCGDQCLWGGNVGRKVP